jgi:hypothetical protein
MPDKYYQAREDSILKEMHQTIEELLANGNDKLGKKHKDMIKIVRRRIIDDILDEVRFFIFKESIGDVQQGFREVTELLEHIDDF